MKTWAVWQVKMLFTDKVKKEKGRKEEDEKKRKINLRF